MRMALRFGRRAGGSSRLRRFVCEARRHCAKTKGAKPCGTRREKRSRNWGMVWNEARRLRRIKAESAGQKRDSTFRMTAQIDGKRKCRSLDYARDDSEKATATDCGQKPGGTDGFCGGEPRCGQLAGRGALLRGKFQPAEARCSGGAMPLKRASLAAMTFFTEPTTSGRSL